MAKLIVKNNVKAAIKELDKENSISSVAADVSTEFQKKVDALLEDGIKRAKANNRRTLLGRDLWIFIKYPLLYLVETEEKNGMKIIYIIISIVSVVIILFARLGYYFYSSNSNCIDSESTLNEIEKITQIINNNTGNQYAPDVYGENIVYFDDRNGNYDIYSVLLCE